jgi:GNAT superfamily N-acetyltransferase
MIIRPARAEEADTVAEVHERTASLAYAHIFPHQPFPREETVSRWRAFPGQILVAEEACQVVGFVAFDESELHALYVLPEHQGAGLGSSLLGAAGEVSRLWVLKENHAGRRFYEAHGWHAEGTERAAYSVVEMLYTVAGGRHAG